MRVNIHELKKALADRLPTIINTYFPNAKKVATGWRLGDAQGNKGGSLWISNDGGFKDHAKPEERGDIIELLQLRTGLKFKELIQQLISELGIQIPEDQPARSTVPTRTLGPLSEQAQEYLASRGISKDFARTLPILSVQNQNIIALLHTDQHGSLGMIKYCKFPDKDFFSEKDPEPIPFPIEYVVKEFPDTDYIILTEGQWDAIILLQYGFPAVTVPNGTGDDSFVERQWNFLHSYKEIYLAFDPDDSGRKFASKVAPRLETTPKLIDLPEGQDVNQFILNHSPDAFNALRLEAKVYQPATIVRADTYAQEAITYNEKDIPADPLPWRAPFGFRANEYTVYVARTHHGKSNLVQCIIANLVGNHGIKVGYAGFESSHIPTASLLIRHHYGGQIPTLQAARAYLAAIYYADQHAEGRMPLRELLDRYTYLYKRFGCTHFVIDNVACLSISREDLGDQADAANAIRQWVLGIPVHAHVVSHPRKPSSGDEGIPGIADIRGAGELAEFSWNILAIWRNTKKERNIWELKTAGVDADKLVAEFRKEPCAKLVCEKQRTTGRLFSLDLWYRQSFKGYTDDPYAA